MTDLSKIVINKAIEDDSNILTEISFAAKRHWKYPDNYFDLWKDELTITKDYINQNIVYKAQLGDLTLGFYSIVENKSDFYSGETFVKQGFRNNFVQHTLYEVIRPLSNARISRNDILYKANTGLVDIALDTKTYIKSLYGATSPQYKQVFV